MGNKKIYWICGYLKPSEREASFLKYGLMLDNIFKQLARSNTALREFEFKKLHTCSKLTFQGIWKDPDTYGIFFDSHGDQHGNAQAVRGPRATSFYEERDPVSLDPRPKVYLVRAESKQELQQRVEERIEIAKTRGLPYTMVGYDDNRVVQLDRDHYQIEIMLGAIPMSSPNLKFAVFMACYTANQRRAWQKLMPPGAKFPELPSKVTGVANAEEAYLDKWIKRLKVPHALFRYLATTVEQGATTISPASTRRGITPLPSYHLPGFRNSAATVYLFKKALEKTQGQQRTIATPGHLHNSRRTPRQMPPPGYGGPKPYTFNQPRRTSPHQPPTYQPPRSVRQPTLQPLTSPTQTTIFQRTQRQKRQNPIGGPLPGVRAHPNPAAPYAIGNPNIVSQIRSQYRPTPQRVPLRHPHGTVSVGTPTITRPSAHGYVSVASATYRLPALNRRKAVPIHSVSYTR